MSILLAANGNPGKPLAFVAAVVVAILAGVITLVIITAKKERLRRAAIAKALGERGLQVAQGLGDREVLGPIEPLASRLDKSVWSASGTIQGLELVAVEHTYTTGAGKSRQTHNHSVVSFALPVAWPALSVTAENFLHRIGELFGMHDIRLEDEAFNKRFRVKCDDENFAILLLNPEVQGLMMAWEKRLSLAIKGNRLCVMVTRHLDETAWIAFLDSSVAFRMAIAPELDAWTA